MFYKIVKDLKDPIVLDTFTEFSVQFPKYRTRFRFTSKVEFCKVLNELIDNNELSSAILRCGNYYCDYEVVSNERFLVHRLNVVGLGYFYLFNVKRPIQKIYLHYK